MTRKEKARGLIQKGLDSGLSFSEIALKTGFHINSISKWHKGALNIRPQNFYKLEKAINGKKENGLDLESQIRKLDFIISEIKKTGFNVSVNNGLITVTAK